MLSIDTKVNIQYILIKHKMFFLGAVICKGRIVWAKMRKAFKIK